MTNFIFYTNPTLTLVCVLPGAGGHFSLDAAAKLTGVHPDMLRYYVRRGLLDGPRAGADDEPTFGEDALAAVRRIEHYRRQLGISRRGLPLICELWREGASRRIAFHFLSGPRAAAHNGR